MNSMFESVGNAIRGRFSSLIPYPTQYDNGPLVSTSDLWVRHTILWGSVQPTEIFRGNFRLTGVMLAQVRQPFLLGEHEVLVVGDLIADNFRSVQDSGVTFRTPTVESFGRDGAYWLVNISCPFFSDEVLTVTSN